MTHLAVILCLAWGTEAAVCSWYGPEHDGRFTASGEVFDHRKLTCASWRYPLGTRLTVWYRGRHVHVTCNDRGPAKRLNRDIDLSLAAFRKLADPDVGLIRNAKVTR